jgi:hypothetical protein
MDPADYLQQVVGRLAGEIGARTYRDLDRLEGAAHYISEQFASFGYQVTRQPFVFGGHTYHNIIAERTGSTLPEALLIVGAHYDSVSTTPGADDNASGVAGVLGLARALTGTQLAKTVRFVAFALEEWPVYRSSNMASYHYAQSLKENNEKVEGMICLEMIGYFCDREGCQRYPFPFMNRIFPKTGNFVSMVGNMRSKSFTEGMAKSFRQGTTLPVVTLNAPAIVIGLDFSALSCADRPSRYAGLCADEQGGRRAYCGHRGVGREISLECRVKKHRELKTHFGIGSFLTINVCRCILMQSSLIAYDVRRMRCV